MAHIKQAGVSFGLKADEANGWWSLITYEPLEILVRGEHERQAFCAFVANFIVTHEQPFEGRCVRVPFSCGRENVSEEICRRICQPIARQPQHLEASKRVLDDDELVRQRGRQQARPLVAKGIEIQA